MRPENCTGGQKRYLARHLYMQQKPKRLQNYIKNLSLQQNKLPGKHNVNKKEQEQISMLFLQTTEEEPEETKIKPIKGPTFQQKFITIQDLNKHRTKQDPCRTTWKIEQSKQLHCNQYACGENISKPNTTTRT